MIFTDNDGKEKKMCGSCKRILPTSEFWRNRASTDGLVSHCKPCERDYKRIYSREYYKRHGDRLRQYQRDRRARRKEKSE